MTREVEEYIKDYPMKREPKYLLRSGYAELLSKMVHFERPETEPIAGKPLSDFPLIERQETYWASRLIWC